MQIVLFLMQMLKLLKLTDFHRSLRSEICCFMKVDFGRMDHFGVN
jgi:hypothetical protein